MQKTKNPSLFQSHPFVCRVRPGFLSPWNALFLSLLIAVDVFRVDVQHTLL